MSVPTRKHSSTSVHGLRTALSPPHPTLPVTFHRAGLDERWTGSWSAPKARASSNSPLEQPTRAALRVTCCHASRGGDVSTWLFCKLTSAITVSRRRNWRRKTRQLNSQSVRNFFPILSDFFSSPAGIGSFQDRSFLGNLEAWILKIRSLMRWLFWGSFF